MNRSLAVAVVVLAAACSGTAPAGGSATPGGGEQSAAAPSACEAVRPRIEQLYRGEARDGDPARAAVRVADNTAMVMGDCATAPERFAPCIAAATSVRDLEARCLVPLDDEGTEGDRRAR